jgi:hypothetical protein
MLESLAHARSKGRDEKRTRGRERFSATFNKFEPATENPTATQQFPHRAKHIAKTARLSFSDPQTRRGSTNARMATDTA